jgi:hypothetical protein
MSAIRAQDRLIAEPQTSLGRLGWVVAVGTACLLLTFILLRHGPLAPAQRPPVATLVQPELAFSVNLPSTAQVDEWTTALDKPLENETQLVLNDAKTVIISLKNSFLPDNDKGL